MIYAVITGDVVGSSQVEGSEKNRLISSLKDAFNCISKWDDSNNDGLPKFDIFRGDSFQGVLPNIETALKASIFIRFVDFLEIEVSLNPILFLSILLHIKSIEKITKRSRQLNSF